MIVVSMMNFKGGVAKTTSSVNLAGAAFDQGLRVLLVDLDPQASATISFLPAPMDGQLPYAGTADILDQTAKPQEVCTNVRRGEAWTNEAGVETVPVLDLWAASSRLVVVDHHLTSKGATKRLRQTLHRLSDATATSPRTAPKGGPYDLVILDPGPSPNMLARNTYYASDLVIVPVSTDAMSLQGMSMLRELMQDALDDDHSVPVLFLPTYYDRRVSGSKQVEEQLRSAYGAAVVGGQIDPKGATLPPIRSSSDLDKAYHRKLTITEYEREALTLPVRQGGIKGLNRRLTGAEDYENLLVALVQLTAAMGIKGT